MRKSLRKDNRQILAFFLMIILPLVGGIGLFHQEKTFFNKALQTIHLPKEMQKIFSRHTLRHGTFWAIYRMDSKIAKPEEVARSIQRALKKAGWMQIPAYPEGQIKIKMTLREKPLKGKKGELIFLPYNPQNWKEWEWRNVVDVWMIPGGMKIIDGKYVDFGCKCWERNGKTYLGSTSLTYRVNSDFLF